MNSQGPSQPGATERPGASPDSAAAIVRRLGPASVLAVLSLSLPALGGIALLWYINPIADWLVGHERAGLVVYAAAFAVLAGLALLPTYAQSILGGWAFGFGLGFPAALAGFFGGALLGYGVAHHASGDRVETLLREKPRWLAVRDALVGTGFWRALGMVALLRLPPNSPFAATNLVMSSVRVPLGAYLTGTLIGMAPRTGAAVWIAAGFRERFSSLAEGLDQPKPWWMFGVSIALLVLALGVIGHVANKAVARVANGRGG